jgi:hypothetical protein
MGYTLTDVYVSTVEHRHLGSECLLAQIVRDKSLTIALALHHLSLQQAKLPFNYKALRDVPSLLVHCQNH